MPLRVNCARCMILCCAVSRSMAIPATGRSSSVYQVPGSASADSSIGLYSQKQEKVSGRRLLTYASSFPFLARCSKPLVPHFFFYSSPILTGKTAETQCNARLSQHCRRTILLFATLLWVSQLSLIFSGQGGQVPKKRSAACTVLRRATPCRVSSHCLATRWVGMFVLLMINTAVDD